MQKLTCKNLVTLIILSFFTLALMIDAQTIPQTNYEKENEYYKIFFRNLFFIDTFSYTLFGEKPLSFEYLAKSGIKSFPLERYCNRILQRKPFGCHARAWLSWKEKYKINTKKFLLIDKIDEDYITIILINKEAFKNTFKNNSTIFANEFGENFTADNLLEKIVKEESFMKALNDNIELLGILCGFGTQNAKLFKEREDLHNCLDNCIENLKSASFINSLNEQIEKYNTIFFTSMPPRNPRPAPYYFLSVGFCQDKNTQESKDIQKKMVGTQKKIAQAYLDKDFYKVIMTELQCTETP